MIAADTTDRRFMALLVALVVLFVVYPVMVELGTLRFFRLVFALVLVLAVYATGGRRTQLFLALALGAPFCKAVTRATPSPPSTSTSTKRPRCA